MRIMIKGETKLFKSAKNHANLFVKATLQDISPRVIPINNKQSGVVKLLNNFIT